MKIDNNEVTKLIDEYENKRELANQYITKYDEYKEEMRFSNEIINNCLEILCLFKICHKDRLFQIKQYVSMRNEINDKLKMSLDNKQWEDITEIFELAFPNTITMMGEDWEKTIEKLEKYSQNNIHKNVRSKDFIKNLNKLIDSNTLFDNIDSILFNHIASRENGILPQNLTSKNIKTLKITEKIEFIVKIFLHHYKNISKMLKLYKELKKLKNEAAQNELESFNHFINYIFEYIDGLDSSQLERINEELNLALKIYHDHTIYSDEFIGKIYQFWIEGCKKNPGYKKNKALINYCEKNSIKIQYNEEKSYARVKKQDKHITEINYSSVYKLLTTYERKIKDKKLLSEK